MRDDVVGSRPALWLNALLPAAQLFSASSKEIQPSALVSMLPCSKRSDSSMS